MKHPLSSFGSYGSDADFSNQDIVNDSSDFGKEYCLGDFGTYGEDAYNSHLDNYSGEDEGLGFKIKVKKPKIKIKPKVSLPKAIYKPIAAITKPVSSVIRPSVIQSALKSVSAPVAKLTSPVIAQATQIAAKAGIPVAALIPSLAKSVQTASIPQAASIPANNAVVLAPKMDEVQVIKKEEAILSQLEPKKYSFSHPLLYTNKKLKGEPMSGFLDDLQAQLSKAATTVYQQNKDKAIAAATTQATNLVGKTLTKLSATDPKAQAAIAKVVSTAATAAQATAVEKAKAAFEANKKYILMGGAAVAGLIALKMFMKKKALA